MSKETLEQKKERTTRIIEILKKEYPDARCTLDYTTPHQLLVAAILAAQCTDERVNQVTPALFGKYPDVEAFANADQSELEDEIKSTGFFRNKTKAIIESARQIVGDYNGRVPDTLDELTHLTGVGRKTANLIIGDAYGKPAVVVDTHVKRVSNRLGLTEHKDPTKIEADLRKILPEQDSTSFNHLLVAHGRAICKAPTPRCEVCRILDLCPYGQERQGIENREWVYRAAAMQPPFRWHSPYLQAICFADTGKCRSAPSGNSEDTGRAPGRGCKALCG